MSLPAKRPVRRQNDQSALVAFVIAIAASINHFLCRLLKSRKIG